MRSVARRRFIRFCSYIAWSACSSSSSKQVMRSGSSVATPILKASLCSDLNALGRATTLHSFLFVHRLVGLFEQFFEAGHALGLERRDADTESEFVSAFVACVVGLEIFIETRDRFFLVGVEIGDEHGELITAEPRDNVGAAETAIKNLGGLNQRVVAFVVTKLVVDLLHAVEVDEEQQQLLLLPAREVEIRRRLLE